MSGRSELERAVAAAGIGAPPHWEEVTDSTNLTAAALAAAGAPGWTVVATAHQTAGRGRLGRSWTDRAGRALLFSLVLHPRLAPADAGLIPLLAGAVMAEAAGSACGVEVRCKWPNDLLTAAGKVGGILAESTVDGGALRHVVVGVGVNLDAPPDLPGAAGLGPAVDGMDLLAAFLGGLRALWKPEAPGFAERVIDRWSAASATLGRTVETTTVGGAVVRGEAVGIDRRGGLRVRTADGDVTVGSGEVRHLA